MASQMASLDRLRDIQKIVGPLSVDNSREWRSRLKKETEKDQSLIQYLKWIQTQDEKKLPSYLHVEDWFRQKIDTDFSNPVEAINFRSTLSSRKVDYLTFGSDPIDGRLWLVSPDPGALRLQEDSLVDSPNETTEQYELQNHPALLLLSVIDPHTADPGVDLPELILPIGRLLHSKESNVISEAYCLQLYGFGERPLVSSPPETYSGFRFLGPPFYEDVFRSESFEAEEDRRKFWKSEIQSGRLKDSDYFVVIDVVTPGHPLWIIYSPKKEDELEDTKIDDSERSASEIYGLEWMRGFQLFAAQMDKLPHPFSFISSPVVAKHVSLKAAEAIYLKHRATDSKELD